MKSIVLAAALAAAAFTAQAQPIDVPKHGCGKAPEMPGKTLMADKMVRRSFDNDLKTYKDCMTGYLDQRKASIKAHEDAANTAISEYNAAMKNLIDAQEAMRGGGDKKGEAGESKKY